MDAIKGNNQKKDKKHRHAPCAFLPTFQSNNTEMPCPKFLVFFFFFFLIPPPFLFITGLQFLYGLFLYAKTQKRKRRRPVFGICAASLSSWQILYFYA